MPRRFPSARRNGSLRRSERAECQPAQLAPAENAESPGVDGQADAIRWPGFANSETITDTPRRWGRRTEPGPGQRLTRAPSVRPSPRGLSLRAPISQLVEKWLPDLDAVANCERDAE